MDKQATGPGKRWPSRLLFLTALSATPWFLIFYCHLSVFDGAPISSPQPSVISFISDTEDAQSFLLDQLKLSEAHDVVDGAEQPKKFPSARMLTITENKRDACSGRYIYVHDLPPRFNADMLRDCREFYRWINMCVYLSNDGLGQPLDNTDGAFSDEGWYATDHFGLDVIFHNRMKQYECLTNDSSLAAAIFVPFYAGFDVVRHLWGHNTSSRDAAGLELVDWLMRQPEWNVMSGHDHFMLSGRTTWDYRRKTDTDSEWGNKLLLLPAVQNMTTLFVEKSPWDDYDFAVPYPTYFHPAKDADIFSWQQRMHSMERKWLFSFAGAPRPGDPNSIRGHLIEQCGSSRFCNLLHCRTGEKKCLMPSNIMRMFQRSRFCLQPPGDTYTRRSAFDAILAGCIPVFFHPASAYIQYKWHLPEKHEKYSVFIAEEHIRSGNVSIEETLRKIEPDIAEQMTENVISLIPRLVYADPRSKLETLKDAVDVTVEAVIDRVTKLRRGMIDRGGHLMQSAMADLSKVRSDV